MIAKYIKKRIGRVDVVSISNSLLVRVGDKIYSFDNPDSPAPHQKVDAIGLHCKYPPTAESIFDAVDKQNAVQDDRQTI